VAFNFLTTGHSGEWTKDVRYLSLFPFDQHPEYDVKLLKYFLRGATRPVTDITTPEVDSQSNYVVL
jgi:hypothetical protein